MTDRKIILVFFFYLSFIIQGSAQKYEIGPMIGVTNVFGDQSNYDLTKGQLGGGFLYKVNKNYRLAYRFSYTYLPTENSLTNQITVDGVDSTVQNQINFQEFAAGIEFNFFDYLKPYKATNTTPYFILQIAALNYNKKLTASIPVGLGIKTKVFSNIAISMETRLQYTFSDELEGGTVGDLNNRNDWYMFTGINVTYIFGRQECYTSPM
ncbi:MAG: DUF6089 family protein [Flavobacteriaceae bacterium]